MNPELIQIFWPVSIVSILVFVVGAYCLIATHNLIRALIGIEILIKGVTLFLILVGHVTGNIALTQALVITLIVIEVALMVVAGCLVLNIFRHNQTIDTRELRNLKG